MAPRFSFLGVVLRSHDVALLVAVLVCLALSWRLARREGLDGRRVAIALGAAAVAALAGGRLHHVIVNWSHYAADPAKLVEIESMHAPGAVLGAFAGAAAAARALGMPLGAFADVLALPAGVGVAIARLGCFLHGCCFGRPTSAWWGVSFPPESWAFRQQAALGLVERDAPRSLPVVPLQLLFAAAGLAIAVFLAFRRRSRPGEAALVFAFLFAVTSGALEMLRDERLFRVFWGPFPQLAWVSWGIAVASLAALGRAGAQRQARR
jgi:phosphatidylglycerol:prolipoprotein diacylglycerol transferase